jgi:YidC/Oxa1 family membrane protein insertase
MGAGIVIVSLGIKVVFTPFMLLTQMNAVKMKLIEPETKIF